MDNFTIFERPPMRALFFVILMSLFGCAQIKSLIKGPPRIIENAKIPELTKDDYSQHLASLEEAIIKNKNIKKVRLSKKNREYLEEVFQRILANNELLLKRKAKPQFHLIENKIPFIFSLPQYKFFISTGLIKKYFKNESLLVSALAFEIVKSGRDVYRAQKVYPLGYIEIPQVLSLTRINLETKMEIYKWTYFALRRSEFDATAILNWIQTQNKNTLDFSWQIRDPRGISREEFLFKNFLVAQGLVTGELQETNSSRSFYLLKDSL